MNTLEKIAGAGAVSVPAFEAMFYKNTAPNIPAARILGGEGPLIACAPLTEHVGNFPESFAAPVFAGILSTIVENYGKRHNNRAIEALGRKLPEIAAASVCAYFTLGESVLPSILPGTPDIKDIPAVLCSAGAGYIIAKLIQRSDIVRIATESVNTTSQYRPVGASSHR